MSGLVEDLQTHSLPRVCVAVLCVCLIGYISCLCCVVLFWLFAWLASCCIGYLLGWLIIHMLGWLVGWRVARGSARLLLFVCLFVCLVSLIECALVFVFLFACSRVFDCVLQTNKQTNKHRVFVCLFARL